MELKHYQKALEIAAEDFFKHGVVAKGLRRYILEGSKEKWIAKHIERWLDRAKQKEGK